MTKKNLAFTLDKEILNWLGGKIGDIILAGISSVSDIFRKRKMDGEQK